MKQTFSFNIVYLVFMQTIQVEFRILIICIMLIYLELNGCT